MLIFKNIGDMYVLFHFYVESLLFKCNDNINYLEIPILCMRGMNILLLRMKSSQNL